MAKNTEAEPFPEEGTDAFEKFINQASTEIETQQGSRSITLRAAGGAVQEVNAEDLKNLSLEQLQSLMGGAVLAAEAIGSDQFGPILDDKGRLVGVPFVLIHWEFHESKTFGQAFVSLWIMTQDGQRYIVNDGSTGICDQLKAVSIKQGIDSMLACPRGLRVSEYDKEMPNGVSIAAKTYYIDTKL